MTDKLKKLAEVPVILLWVRGSLVRTIWDSRSERQIQSIPWTLEGSWSHHSFSNKHAAPALCDLWRRGHCVCQSRARQLRSLAFCQPFLGLLQVQMSGNLCSSWANGFIEVPVKNSSAGDWSRQSWSQWTPHTFHGTPESHSFLL